MKNSLPSAISSSLNTEVKKKKSKKSNSNIEPGNKELDGKPSQLNDNHVKKKQKYGKDNPDEREIPIEMEQSAKEAVEKPKKLKRKLDNEEIAHDDSNVSKKKRKKKKNESMESGNDLDGGSISKKIPENASPKEFLKNKKAIKKKDTDKEVNKHDSDSSDSDGDSARAMKDIQKSKDKRKKHSDKLKSSDVTPAHTTNPNQKKRISNDNEESDSDEEAPGGSPKASLKTKEKRNNDTDKTNDAHISATKKKKEKEKPMEVDGESDDSEHMQVTIKNSKAKEDNRESESSDYTRPAKIKRKSQKVASKASKHAKSNEIENDDESSDEEAKNKPISSDTKSSQPKVKKTIFRKRLLGNYKDGSNSDESSDSDSDASEKSKSKRSVGNFSRKEQQHIENAIESYLKERDIPWSDIPLLLNRRKKQDNEQESNPYAASEYADFWKVIKGELGTKVNRDRHQIHRYVTRRYGKYTHGAEENSDGSDKEFKKAVPWSAEEDRQLMEYVQLLGFQWSVISSKIGRLDCHSRYKLLETKKKGYTSGKWARDEIDRLIAAVEEIKTKKYLPKLKKKDSTNNTYDEVEFNKILKNHWDDVSKNASTKYHPQGAMTKDDKWSLQLMTEMLKKIKELHPSASDESEINWQTIGSQLSYPRSAKNVTEQWVRIRQHVDENLLNNMTFKETLIYLLDNGQTLFSKARVIIEDSDEAADEYDKFEALKRKEREEYENLNKKAEENTGNEDDWNF